MRLLESAKSGYRELRSDESLVVIDGLRFGDVPWNAQEIAQTPCQYDGSKESIVPELLTKRNGIC